MKAMPASLPAESGVRPPAGTLDGAFARYQDELLGTLYFLVGNADDAREALQEAFLKCWRHREEVAGIENLKAWIFRIALNTGRDVRSTAWRRRRHDLEGNGHMLVAKEPPPAVGMQQREDLDRVRAAVMELRPEEQEIFLLRQNGDLTYDEIARSVGLPLGTVKTRMRLAIEKLRLALGPV